MPDPEVIKTLKEARALIEKGWTQHSYGRDANGNSSLPKDKNSVAWCLRGALLKANGPGELGAINVLSGLLKDTYLPYYNDAPGRTQEEVLALLDQAIEEASK